MNRRRGLWTLPGRGWLGLLGVIVSALAVWAAFSATQPATPAATAGDMSDARPGALPAAPTPGQTPTGGTATSSAIAIIEPPLLGKTAVETLALLPVRNADSGADYQRTQDFGAAWIDVDGNGCDTRDDILLRDLHDAVLNGCKVMSGAFVDPYTGQPMTFTRGNDTSALVQIDHMVALLDAWTTGAQQLTQDQRQRLANDPTNLLAVSEQANQDKSAADAASWLPPFVEMHCEYAARQISVKYAYGLWVTPSEHDALATILRSCPDQPAYRSSLEATTVPPTAAPTESSTGSVGFVGGDGGSSVYYANCSAAYAAGVSRILRGAPGYRPELDRDGDGIACEG